MPTARIVSDSSAGSTDISSLGVSSSVTNDSSVGSVDLTDVSPHEKNVGPEYPVIPLPPLDKKSFAFPRVIGPDEPHPTFPFYKLPGSVARMAARLGTERWLAWDAQRNGSALDAGVFICAVVDSVIERCVHALALADLRYESLQDRTAAERRSRPLGAPVRRLRRWGEWVAVTDCIIIDALEAVSHNIRGSTNITPSAARESIVG